MKPIVVLIMLADMPRFVHSEYLTKYLTKTQNNWKGASGKCYDSGLKFEDWSLISLDRNHGTWPEAHEDTPAHSNNIINPLTSWSTQLFKRRSSLSAYHGALLPRTYTLIVVNLFKKPDSKNSILSLYSTVPSRTKRHHLSTHLLFSFDVW